MIPSGNATQRGDRVPCVTTEIITSSLDVDAGHVGNIRALAGHDDPASRLEPIVDAVELDRVALDVGVQRLLGELELLGLGVDDRAAKHLGLAARWIRAHSAGDTSPSQEGSTASWVTLAVKAGRGHGDRPHGLDPVERDGAAWPGHGRSRSVIVGRSIATQLPGLIWSYVESRATAEVGFVSCVPSTSPSPPDPFHALPESGPRTSSCR